MNKDDKVLNSVPSFEDAMKALRMGFKRSQRVYLADQLKQFYRDYAEEWEGADNLNDEMKHVDELVCIAKVIKILEK